MQGPRHDITIGDRAPDFVLPVVDGKHYHFYERTKGGPVTLLFAPDMARGGRDEIKRFVQKFEDFKTLGADILAISHSGSKANGRLDLPFFNLVRHEKGDH